VASVRPVQKVVNQVVVASSSSAAETWVEDSSSLEVELEPELSLELELELELEMEMEMESELVAAEVVVAAGAAVPLLELQPATSNPPAASTLIQDERFMLSLAFRAGAPPARCTVTHHRRPKGDSRKNCDPSTGLRANGRGGVIGAFPSAGS